MYNKQIWFIIGIKKIYLRKNPDVIYCNKWLMENCYVIITMILIYILHQIISTQQGKDSNIFLVPFREISFSRMQYLCFYCCCNFISLFIFWTGNYVICTVEAQRTHENQCSSDGEYLKFYLTSLTFHCNIWHFIWHFNLDPLSVSVSVSDNRKFI